MKNSRVNFGYYVTQKQTTQRNDLGINLHNLRIRLKPYSFLFAAFSLQENLICVLEMLSQQDCRANPCNYDITGSPVIASIIKKRQF